MCDITSKLLNLPHMVVQSVFVNGVLGVFHESCSSRVNPEDFYIPSATLHESLTCCGAATNGLTKCTLWTEETVNPMLETYTHVHVLLHSVIGSLWAEIMTNFTQHVALWSPLLSLARSNTVNNCAGIKGRKCNVEGRVGESRRGKLGLETVITEFSLSSP